MALATREQVLAAYRNNPKASLNPDENAIQYWMANGIENFDSIVDQVRASNPELAAQIDEERAREQAAASAEQERYIQQLISPLDSNRIYALGDSTTAGYYTGTHLQNNMITEAQDSLRDVYGNDVTLVNKGVDSTALSDAISRGYINEAINDSSKTVLLNYGLNEAYRGTSPEDFKNQLKQTAQALKNSGKTVVLQTPNYTPSNEINNLQSYVDAIRSVSNELGLALDDKYVATQNATFDPNDLIHPTQQVYTQLGQNLSETLSGVFDQQFNQMYQDIVGKAPDPEGLNYWRQQFGTDISPEEKDTFKRTALNETAQQAFGRPLTEAERSELFKLGSVQEANNWAAEKGRAWEQEQQARKTLITSNFANIYNNSALSTQQKAQQINQFAQQNNLSRDEIASAMNIGANDLNAFLDTDPAVVQNRVNNLLQIVSSPDKPGDFRYETNSEGETISFFTEQGLAAKQARKDAASQLEALGYEFFDPDGPAYQDDFGTVNEKPAKWLSPQEAASVTGTKINNQLRNQAYIKSTENLASQLSPLANQLRQKLDAVNASGNLVVNQPARYYNEVANRLTQRTGITDLNDVGVRKLEGRWIELGGDPPVARFFRTGSNQGELYDEEIYNKKTGQVYEQGNFINLGTFGNKQDETSALLKIGPDGNIKLNAGYAYEQEAWKDVVTAVAPIAINFVPGAGQFLGAAILPAGTSAAVQTAVGNLVIKTGIDVAAGVPLDVALKNNFVSAGVNTFLPDLSGNAFIDNAVKAVSIAALTDGDVNAALVNSVISTGGKEVLGNVSLTGDKVVDSAITSAVNSAASAIISGGDVGESAVKGFGSGLSAGINAANQTTTIPGVPAQTITGAAGNDSIPAAGGIDTVGGITGADTVNAGVAQNDVLDLIQRDIDTSVANNTQGTLNAEQDLGIPPIDPRIAAQGVAGGQFGDGELLQTGGNVSSYVLPPNPQSEFGVQKNINARPDFNESSLGAKYGEINSPHYGKLISSIMINDVVDANGNPIDTPVGYYAIYDPDTKSTFYEFSLSDGTTVTSKTRPFVEQGKIFSEDKFFELKPSRQPSELNIDTGAGNGAFLGETQDLAVDPTTGITVSASKPTIDQRLLDLVEQAPDQESATNATVAYYQALDNDLSDDEALDVAKTAMQAKSPPILFEDSVVDQKPTEQQVADTSLTAVGQPVNQTLVVSPTTPSLTTPTTSPAVTEPVVTQPSVTQPVVTQPVTQQPTTGSTTGTTTSGTGGSTTGITSGAVTGDTTGTATGGAVGTGATDGTTGGQLDTGGSSVITDTASGGGTDVSGGAGDDLIVGGGNNNVISEDTSEATKTEEDLLLEQIIQELETKPPVSESVPIPEPEFPEPPLIVPETPPINVDTGIQVRTRTERPTVMPGSRVEESAQILPLRPGLSEGGTGGIEGTTEQEQEPVWNVRSLKLRRLLGI